MGSSVIRRSATLAVFLALALGAPIAHAAHTPGATVTIADKRDPATFEGSGDPDVTPLVVLPNDDVKPAAMEQLMDVLNDTAKAPVTVVVTELRVLDYFPERFEDKVDPSVMASDAADWALVKELKVPTDKNSIVCVFAGTVNGKPFKFTAQRAYDLGFMTIGVRGDKHYRAAVKETIDDVAGQMMALAAQPDPAPLEAQPTEPSSTPP